MSLSRAELDQVSLYPFASEGELLKEIQNLIEIFNLRRDEISSLYKSRKSISAYLYYYFVTNIPRVELAVERLGGAAIFGDAPIIEFGAGARNLPLALKNISNDFHLVESSELMQESGRSVLKSFAPNVNYKYYSKYWDVPVLNKPVLCFTNSFNEMEDDEFWKLIDLINPEKVLFIEPGTKEVFKRLLPVRDKLIENGMNITYPCSKITACPLLEKDDWCHQYLKLTHDPSIERLTQKLGRDRRMVPLILHFYQRGESKGPQAIVFSKPEPRKYGHDLRVCEDNELKKYKFLKRNSSYEKKYVKSLLPGTALSFQVLKNDEITLEPS